MLVTRNVGRREIDWKMISEHYWEYCACPATLQPLPCHILPQPTRITAPAHPHYCPCPPASDCFLTVYPALLHYKQIYKPLHKHWHANRSTDEKASIPPFAHLSFTGGFYITVRALEKTDTDEPLRFRAPYTTTPQPVPTGTGIKTLAYQMESFLK